MNEEKLIDSIIELACELDRGDIKLDELVKEAYALVKKDRAEQLTLTDVVEPFYCDVIVGEEGYRCKKQCDMCKEFPE
jgi:hypothetical protein